MGVWVLALPNCWKSGYLPGQGFFAQHRSAYNKATFRDRLVYVSVTFGYKIVNTTATKRDRITRVSPVHTTLEKFENSVLFLRLGLPSTLIRHENRVFRKRSSNRRNLKTQLYFYG